MWEKVYQGMKCKTRLVVLQTGSPCCVAITSVGPFPCHFSIHFKSTICPMLGVANPSEFSFTFYVLLVVIHLCW